MIDTIDKILELHKQIKHIKSPLGTKESPARSCLDLLLQDQDAIDGYFWVDPNGGCISDAVEVYCNFTEGVAKTCILPERREAERQPWSGDSIWFSALNGGFQLSYDIPKSQLQFLRVSSRFGSQTFTYHCRNTAASVLFRTHNNKEITPTKVLSDGCQGRPSMPDVSVLEVSTKQVQQLPLKDFAAVDVGEATGQEFGFEMGPACFY